LEKEFKMKAVSFFLILPATIAMAALTLACSAQNAQLKTQSATFNSGHSVTLNWQPSAGAKFYCIYRSTTSKSGYQKIGTSAGPTYKDAPVPAGTTFYYVVTAVSSQGESKYSGEIKAVVP
jgi:fibronectin type 3 domain-containing protein